MQADGVVLDNIKVRKDTNGIQSVGSIETKGLFVQWPGQRLQGDISFNSLTMRVKDENDITVEGGLEADNFSTSINDKSFKSQHILLENMRLECTGSKKHHFEYKIVPRWHVNDP